MPRITPIDPYKLIKILSKGSHIILIDARRVRIVVPVHPGRLVKPGHVRAIISVYSRITAARGSLSFLRGSRRGRGGGLSFLRG